MGYNKKNIIKYVVNILLFILIVAILFNHRRHFHCINMGNIKRYIQSYGRFSALVFLLLYMLRPIMFLMPASLMAIIAGNIFNYYVAVLLNMIGCFGSATIAFFLARFLGRSFVDKCLKGKALKFNKNIEKYGFKIMTIMRLCFVFPYDPLSYSAGLTKIKYRDFILGTLVGVFPEIVTYSLMGKHLGNPFSFKFILPIMILFIIAFISVYTYKRSKNTSIYK
ncbi:TVP38/TMEM64 family protein [Clostridium sp. WILCCON 0269]|uniref:TVP38/TMEM64 family membrane protein n=1 Tax=Candidatus Clostridium eludens TaxID=3381663 RepID=A0ABW8SK04_9CLOT